MIASSLRSRLRWLIVGVFAAVLLPLGVLSFRLTLTEVNELSDGRLAQAAHSLQVLIGHAGIDALSAQPTQDMVVSSSNTAGASHTYEGEVGFQVFSHDGQLLLQTANMRGLAPPQPGVAAFHNVRHNGYRWRVYVLADARDGVVIRSAERYDSRNDILRALWFDHGMPLLIGLPLMALLVGWAVRRGLRPLDALTRALAQREPGSRESIVLERTPQELVPVLDALNGQLARLEDALERERRFSADVAHELRTPLASTMINLESAMATANLEEASASLESAAHCVTALARRVEQLLDLARLESGAAAGPRESVDLALIAIDVLEDSIALILERGVALSFTPPGQPVLVLGYEAALNALLRNLLENALRHVHGGGQVQLVITPGRDAATIDVIDDGPGIAHERRDDVFRRFHRESSSRGEGYGLGLSIVQRAAELHDAQIQLLDSPLGRGLLVRVSLPNAGGKDG